MEPRLRLIPLTRRIWYTTSSSGVSVERCNLGVACKPSDFGPPTISESTVGGDGRTMPVPAVFTLDSVDPSQILVGTCRVWRGPANGSSWSASNAISGMLDKLTAPLCNGNAIIRSLASPRHRAANSFTQEWQGCLDGGATAAGHLYRASWNGSASTWADISTIAREQCQPALQPGQVRDLKHCSGRARCQRSNGVRHHCRLQREWDLGISCVPEQGCRSALGQHEQQSAMGTRQLPRNRPAGR